MFKRQKDRPANLAVGKPDVHLTAPSHVAGVHSGNATGRLAGAAGLVPLGTRLEATARRSTGIDPDGHEPIDPTMPHLTPA